MKFDNFVKYAAGHGSILVAENSDEQLFYEGIGMLIPQYSAVCGTLGKMPEYIDKLIYEFTDFDSAELTDAYLPEPYSKPSEIRRVFSSDNLDIDISNKAFGLIEKADLTYINSYEDEGEDEKRYVVLLVSDTPIYDVDTDTPEFGMIRINRMPENK